MEILHSNFTCDMGVAMCQHCPGGARLRFWQNNCGFVLSRRCFDEVSGLLVAHHCICKCAKVFSTAVFGRRYCFSFVASRKNISSHANGATVGWTAREYFTNVFPFVGFSSRSSVCVHGPSTTRRLRRRHRAAGTCSRRRKLLYYSVEGKGRSVAQAAGGGEGLEVKKGTVTVTARQ